MRSTAPSTPITVTELTARIKQVLEQGFSQVEVTGEISRLTTPSSGHLYFTIKDAHAAISAVVWRSAAARLKTKPKEGQAYVFIGHLSLYEPRGTYQLVITRIESVGAGRLAAEFERRKALFAERGWFDSTSKHMPPQLPQHIGIITSATAAAFEDVKKVLTTRPTWLQITLSPALVQGEAAPASISQAFQRFAAIQPKKNQPDVILLVRGGGSIEDLWCFNDEKVVQSIVDCAIPVISGVGHEIDTTLADLAADMRAATPSNAAELACPDRDSLQPKVANLVNRLSQTFSRYQDDKNWILERHNNHLNQSFQALVHQKRHQIQRLKGHLHTHEATQKLRQNGQQLYALQHRLQTSQQSLNYQYRQHLSQIKQVLCAAYQSKHQQQSQLWHKRHEQLLAMNPKHVLKRGYAMTTDQHGKIVSSAQQLQAKDTLHLHFQDGDAQTKVTSIQLSEKS